MGFYKPTHSLTMSEAEFRRLGRICCNKHQMFFNMYQNLSIESTIRSNKKCVK